MTSDTRYQLLTGGFIILGLIAILAGVWYYRNMKAFVGRAAKAQAYFVTRRMETGAGNPGFKGLFNRYKVTAADGKVYPCEAKISSLPFFSKPQKTAEVLYDPNNPKKAHINTRVELYGAPVILLIWGIFALIAVALLHYVLFPYLWSRDMQ